MAGSYVNSMDLIKPRYYKTGKVSNISKNPIFKSTLIFRVR